MKRKGSFRQTMPALGWLALLLVKRRPCAGLYYVSTELFSSYCGIRSGEGEPRPSRHPALDPLPIAPASEASGLPVPGSSTSAQSSIGATAVFGPGTTSGSEQGPEGADCAVAPGGCTAEAFSGWGPEKTKEEIVNIVREILKFERNQIQFSKKFGSVEEALRSGPGLLDLFAGAGGFSKAFVRKHQTWSLSFDIKNGSDEDLLDPWLQKRLLKLLRAGAFRATAASPVCASFSTAITPPWRSKEFPAGKPDLTAEQVSKIELGQQQQQQLEAGREA